MVESVDAEPTDKKEGPNVQKSIVYIYTTR